MKLTASYFELSNLIYDKTGKQIELEYGGNDNSFIFKYINIPCHVYITKVESDSVTLSYQIGNVHSEIISDPCPGPLTFIGGLFRHGAQKFGNKAADIIIDNFVKHPAVSSVAERTLKIDLSKISQLADVLKLGEIDGIYFNDTGTTLDVILKTNKQI